MTLSNRFFPCFDGRFPHDIADAPQTALVALRSFFWAAAALACSTLVRFEPLAAQDRPGTNSDEAKVRAYDLPDPLTATDGSRVTDARGWTDKRRGELLELFRSQMYGRSPARPEGMKFEFISTEPKVLDGLATRQEIDICLSAEADSPKIRILLYVPNAAPQPTPVALGGQLRRQPHDPRRSGNHDRSAVDVGRQRSGLR